jgi:membrane-bound metal-dependent hydrolase YbcI (DUF457 family)
MFIGHFAVGFAAKKVAPRVSLGTFFLAALLLDGIWPVLVLTGVERVEIAPGNTAFTPLDFVSYPYSHSLLMTVLWAVLFAAIYWGLRRNLSGAFWVALAVASHWVLDAITHRPDLPLYPGGGPVIGLGLWNSITGTVLVEGLMFAGALAIYVTCTRATDGIGLYALWALVALLLVPYFAGILGPPPPNAQAVAIADLLGAALSVAWGYWINRHRVPA